MQNLKIIPQITAAFSGDLKNRYVLNRTAINRQNNTTIEKLNDKPGTKRQSNFRRFKINLFTIYLYTIELLYTFYK